MSTHISTGTNRCYSQNLLVHSKSAPLRYQFKVGVLLIRSNPNQCFIIFSTNPGNSHLTQNVDKTPLNDQKYVLIVIMSYVVYNKVYRRY